MRQHGDEAANSFLTIDAASRATPDSNEGRVLLHLQSGRMCATNAMGSRIWTELEAGRSFQDMVDILAAEYDAPRERIEADVRAFIAQLAAKGYVRTPGLTP